MLGRAFPLAGFRFVLEKYRLFATRDPKIAEAKLMAVSGARSFTAKNDRSGFAFTSNLANLKDISLHYVSCSIAGASEMVDTSYIRQCFPISGAARLTFDGAATDITPRSPGLVVPSETIILFEGSARFSGLTVRIPMKALQRKLGVILDTGPVDHLRFETSTPLKGAMVQFMRQAVFQLASDLDAFGETLAEVALHELEQSILTRHLLFHQHNHSRSLGSPAPLVSRFQLSAAEGYIEANWDKPLDIELLAEAVGTSVRSVFRHFKKARGCSPFEFAKQVRLQQARNMLQAGQERSVIGIALKCGFHSIGHFAEDYRFAFGELPSQTMRQSMR